MLSITLFEFLNASSRVNKFLFAGEKRMAGRADLNLHLFHYRSYFYFITTRAGCINCIVLRMNSVFHSPYSSITLRGEQNLTIMRITFLHKGVIIPKQRIFSTKNGGFHACGKILCIHGIKEISVGFLEFQFIYKEIHAIGGIH